MQVCVCMYMATGMANSVLLSVSVCRQTLNKLSLILSLSQSQSQSLYVYVRVRKPMLFVSFFVCMYVCMYV